MEDTTIEDVLKTFEGHYAQKDYSGALEFLQKNQKDISPGLWHYNLGTVYAKMENFPMARLHLLLAEKNGFKGKEVDQNISFVEEKLEIHRLEKPISVNDYFVKAGLFLSEGILTTITLLVLFVGLWVLKKKRSILRVVSFLISVIFLLGINLWMNTWRKALLVSPQILYSGPSVIFESRGEIPAGIMVMTKGNSNWLEIIYPSRFQGWIKNGDLKNLE